MKSVGFLVYTSWTEFGYSETLYSWFSTICYRLENKKWGSRFPVVMNKLYYDEENGVPYEDLDTFKAELATIKNEFSRLSVKDAIWSFEENVLEIPPNMPNINYNTMNLVEYYIKSNSSKNIFDVLFRKCESMQYFKKNCRIISEKDFFS